MEAPAKTAAHLGLLINEAITNSFKHAVPRGATEIALSLAKLDSGLILTISDNGPGLEDADPRHVGGTGLMRAFARGLRATLETGGGGGGMRYVVKAPLARRPPPDIPSDDRV
jgi:two-component sensor histidine kinase